MVVDFERVIDSDQDMVDLGRPIYLPEGTPFLQLYLGSPDPAQRALGKQVELNKKDQLYIYDKGLMPIEKEREMIKYGKNLVVSTLLVFNSEILLSWFGLNYFGFFA